MERSRKIIFLALVLQFPLQADKQEKNFGLLEALE